MSVDGTADRLSELRSWPHSITDETEGLGGQVADLSTVSVQAVYAFGWSTAWAGRKPAHNRATRLDYNELSFWKFNEMPCIGSTP